MSDLTDAGILTTASDVLFTGGREGYFFASTRGRLASLEDPARRADPEWSHDLLGRRQAIRRRQREQFVVRFRIAYLTSCRDLRDAAAAVSWSRREFLREATGACLGSGAVAARVAGGAGAHETARRSSSRSAAARGTTRPSCPTAARIFRTCSASCCPAQRSSLRSSTAAFSATTSPTPAWRPAPTRPSTTSSPRRRSIQRSSSISART